MQATRYRLRWSPGLGLQTAFVYGSGAYGSGSYGFESTGTVNYGDGLYGDGDYGELMFALVTSMSYEAIPWTAGWPTMPSWIYRVGDTWPAMQVRIYGDDIPVNLNTMLGATIVLTPMDGRPRTIDLEEWGDGRFGDGNYGEVVEFPLEIYLAAALVPSIPGLLTHVFQLPPPLLDQPGVYRVVVFLQFPDNRYLTVPCDDEHNLVVIDERRRVA